MPVLSVREGAGGGIEIVNMGSITANDIVVELIETQKRASGELSVKKSLTKDESAIITAHHCLDEIHRQYPPRDFEANIRRLHGEESRTPPDQLARHLLIRTGTQMLIVSYSVPDSAKRIVRIFAPVETNQREYRFMLHRKYSAKPLLPFYHWLYRKNAIYGPTPDFSKLSSSVGK